MGIANAAATRNALAGQGVYVSGYQWRWAVGLKDGTYPPHLELDHEVRPFETSFEAQPGEDWNGDACMCAIVPQYRGPDGRFAKPGFVREPRFAPPVTASQTFDWQPLVEALSMREFTLNVPDGAFVVNVPEATHTFHVAAPRVEVAAPAVTVTPSFNVEPVTVMMDSPVVTVTPTFAVEAPNVNVAPAVVNVAAANVTVEPKIEVKPAPVRIVREKAARMVRFGRNSTGQIETAEVDDG